MTDVTENKGRTMEETEKEEELQKDRDRGSGLVAREAAETGNILGRLEYKICPLSVPAEPPAPTCIAACFKNFLPSDIISAVTAQCDQIIIPSEMHCVTCNINSAIAQNNEEIAK